MPKALPFAALAAFVAAPAQADLFGPAYLDAGFQHQVEQDDLEGEGYDVGAALDLGTNFFVGASYSSVRTEPFALDEDGTTGRLEYRSVGGSFGGFLPVADWGGISAAAGYSVSRTYGLDALSEDPVEQAEGVTGSFGLHYGLVRWVDLSLGRSYSFIGGQRGWDASAGLSLLAWRGVWIDTSYWIADSIEGWTAGLRVRFGH